MFERLSIVLVVACHSGGPPPVAPKPPATHAEPEHPTASAGVAAAKQALLAKHPDRKAAIERGVDQVATLSCTSDGDLAAFCIEQLAADDAARDALFARLEAMFEQIDGHVLAVDRTAKWGAEVENGKPPLPIDGVRAGFDLGARARDDLFDATARALAH